MKARKLGFMGLIFFSGILNHDLHAKELARVGVAPPSNILAVIPHQSGELRFEEFADGTLIMTERASSNDETPMQALMRNAKSKKINLCPAQIFGMLTPDPIPESLWSRCADIQNAKQTLVQLKADAKVFRIFEGEIRSRPGFCNNINNDAAQFRELECDAELSDLYDDSFYDSDHSYWCANTLRSDSDRSMSTTLGDEGEAASTRMVSCGGNTRFRFYKRDSTSDSWNLYRDYNIGANEYFTLYSYDNDSYGDSDFRFRLNSSAGAWHRNTGYFIDD